MSSAAVKTAASPYGGPRIAAKNGHEIIECAVCALASPAVQRAADTILLKRMGRPEKVVDAMVFPASDAASCITAQTIDINGGLYF